MVGATSSEGLLVSRSANDRRWTPDYCGWLIAVDRLQRSGYNTHWWRVACDAVADSSSRAYIHRCHPSSQQQQQQLMRKCAARQVGKWERLVAAPCGQRLDGRGAMKCIGRKRDELSWQTRSALRCGCSIHPIWKHWTHCSTQYLS